MKAFNKEALSKQFDNIEWIETSGSSEKELVSEFEALMENADRLPRAIVKAKTLELILSKSRIAIDKDDIFQDKVFGGNLMLRQRSEWENGVISRYLREETEEIDFADKVCGACNAGSDYGHTSPNSRLLVNIGITGLLDRIEQYCSRDGLTGKQKVFYESCRIALEAMLTLMKRLSEAVAPYNAGCSEALLNLTKAAPSNIYEAMQLVTVYFFVHEFIAGTRVRTLGRVDDMLYPFYKSDLENGTFTKEEIKEMLKFFLNKFWTAHIPYDLPFCLGGIGADGNEVTNELSYLIVETYNELDIHSPKIHIRVSHKTPASFVKLVLSCIRGGNSSFVFVNDNSVVKSLTGVGIEKTDAMDYVPIGCYEPAVWGKEIGCTGNAHLNLPKAVELVMNGGRDLKTGKLIGLESGKVETFTQFMWALKNQIKYLTQKCMDYVCKIERHYGDINPDPILSSMYDESVKRGVDVYEGGALYNNSSMYFYSIATLTDCIMAVKKLVFDEERVSFEELCAIMKNNWEGHKKLHFTARNMKEKYGNGNPEADRMAKEMAEFCASLVNNKPNGRGGVFKASCFTIDKCFACGKKTMATPDGRMSGEPNSKNLCATVAKDRNGITALINSVTAFDHSLFPNGSVLDIVVHPSAVKGDDGLEAFFGIVRTYFDKGGMAMHGNVFDPEDLIAAQKNPEQYKTLQVRVCGWNVYFVNLSKEEQDAFIAQAKNA